MLTQAAEISLVQPAFLSPALRAPHPSYLLVTLIFPSQCLAQPENTALLTCLSFFPTRTRYLKAVTAAFPLQLIPRVQHGAWHTLGTQLIFVG